MPFPWIFQSKPKKREWINCCKAPPQMTIEPPLPDDYTAWIHRAGWMMYVHEPTQQGSWMHPVKLAQLEARGLKGPGKIGPEMWILEKDVNRGGHYIVDYGHPPWGKVTMSFRPVPRDFAYIDKFGWDAWKAKRDAELEEARQEVDARGHREKTEKEWEFLRMYQKVMKEQGAVRSSEKDEIDIEQLTEEDKIEREDVMS